MYKHMKATHHTKLDVAKAQTQTLIIIILTIYDTAALQDEIDATVAQGVVIISDTKCPFCAKAKALLSSLGTAYQVQIFHILVQRFNKLVQKFKNLMSDPLLSTQSASYQAVELYKYSKTLVQIFDFSHIRRWS